MAECSIARCSQERRFFRKELQKWSKDILYVVGLERVAEELMGAVSWKRLIEPFTDLEETIDPVDWNPEEICYFCNAKKLPPYDPASGVLHSIDGYNSLKVDTDDQSTSSDQGTAPGSFTSCSSALSPWYSTAVSSHGPSCSPPPLDQPLDLSVHSARRAPERQEQKGLSLSSLSLQAVASLAARTSEDAQEPSSGSSVLKVPQIPVKPGHRKRIDGNCKRSYTEEELQAALRDIQSGKLGTRRAAVIYGIPRSTLRNKVYKLANESKSRAHSRVPHNSVNSATIIDKVIEESVVNDADVQSSPDVNNTKLNNSSSSNNTSASESLRQLLKHTITQKAQSLSKGSEKQSNHQQDFSPQNLPLFYNPDALAAIQMLSTLEYSQTLAPVLSQVFANIQHLALAKCKENYHLSNQSLSALKDDLKLPLLPDLIHRLAEERLEIERERQKDSDAVNTDHLTAELDTAARLSNVILKVPSYKPAKSPPADSELAGAPSSPPLLPSSSAPSGTSSSSHTHSGNKGITVSLKELIARSINQRVNNSHTCKESAKDEPPVKRPNLSANIKNSNSAPWPTSGSQKEFSSGENHSNEAAGNSSDSSKPEKRTRPKRGRYRNYDRDNLARAVRAVQRGEMSVHRAGTFYGVPHSTLEYKVKERHLLRPRKRDSPLNSSNSGTSLTSKNSQNPSGSSVKVGSKGQKNSVLNPGSEQLNGLKTPLESSHRPSLGTSFPSQLSLWQSMPFFSLDFSQLGSNNFFASQMMRKLQENARLHEEAQKKRKNQELGILETLIKSTLDRSISPESKASSSFLMSAEKTATLSGETEDSEVADEK